MAAKGFCPLGGVTESGEDVSQDVHNSHTLPCSAKVHQSRTSRGLISVAASMPGCLFATTLFWSCQWVEMDISQAFFRTFIECDPPVPSSSGNCPVGSFYQENSCVPVPNGQPGWSGSANCFDQNYVVRAGTQLSGRINTLGIVGTVIANLCVSTILIDTLGRKPAMVMAFVGCSLLCGISAFAATLSASVMVLVCSTATLLVYMFNGFQCAAQSMASDLSRPDEVSRSLAMSGVNMARNSGTLFGFSIGFFVLKLELVDYGIVWAVLSALVGAFSVFIMMTLRETLPTQKSTTGFSMYCCMLSCLDKKRRSWLVNIVRSFRLVWRDPFLRLSLPLSNILACTGVYGCLAMTGSWAISMCKYNQATTSLMGIVQPSMIVLGSLSCSFIVPLIGAYYAGAIGLLCTAAGLGIAGIGAYSPTMAPAFWWAGHGVLAGLGQGITMPCLAGEWSRRVSANDQGKLFAISALTAGIGSSIGTYVFSNHLFTNLSTDTSFQQARGWLVGSALHILVLFINILAYARHILPHRHSQNQLRTQRAHV